MSIIGTSRFTERIKFFDGQRLFASDLQDLEEFNRQIRWLHNQSLHQPGVADGYAVSGKKDDREVTIEPGYAIDSLGREIVLTRAVVLQIPPVATDGNGNPVYFDLTVSYPSDRALKETRDGVCVSRGAVRLRDEPVFCWVELVPTSDPPGVAALSAERQAKLEALNEQVESGLRIRLARAEIFNCQLNQPLSLSGRRNAKPSMQPFLYAGRTPAENNWASEVTGLGITISLNVDTRVGQFRSTPRYFAHAVGNRQVTLQIDSKPVNLVLDGFSRVAKTLNKPLTEGFRFSLLIPAILIDLRGLKLTLAQVSDALNKDVLKAWYVEWLGIE